MMRLKPGTYFNREGLKVDIVGVSDGWAYTSDLTWFYADTGQSALKFSRWRHFPCPYDLIERLAHG
jgi:hypothetical protein